MIRSWRVWIAVSACLLLALAGVVWLSMFALRLDRTDRLTREQGAREENVRLALWRLDSELMPLVGRESGVSVEAYSASIPVRDALDERGQPVPSGTLWLTSPLSHGPPEHVLLHFQVDPFGRVTSPQTPGADADADAHPLADLALDTSEMQARLHRLDTVKALLASVDVRRALADERPTPSRRVAADEDANNKLVDLVQRTKNSSEYVARVRGARQAAIQTANAYQQQALLPVKQAAPALQEMRGLWVKSSLLLVRRVQLADGEYIQGCWLDWDALKPWLLARVGDLLPRAVLEPARSAEGEGVSGEGRLLAALPVRLVPGRAPDATGSSGALSSLPLVLTVAWSGVVLAGIAVVALLVGVLSLSERRGAFVSAVTHELRTPLTTFRMYTEMLAAGMVPDAQRRQEYFDILHREAERLSHLVENVLAYARIERGRTPAKLERLDARAMVERMEPRLRERAAQAGLSLCVELPSGVMVMTDPSAVEQVLFNLVDNASKYAANTEAPRVHVELVRRGRLVGLAVWDHGPGIDKATARKLFEPFSKSVQAAARSAPGVGLGLALCRRLARSMRGDLRHERVATGGARFVLWLPSA
ncbi:HAMP domain-containing histidine kinase [Myxococcus sp. K15C18031901]|uniref:sensor histidine kinase n=1 Tax=Myxococcus dinghuensis TaxID=2906761 RepID=UPI0020A79CF3|nr:HAMP domain-containing sensor histidine kinase [Myxococcus dinghuensis]MCP3099980.1 HAMP domain-containing histidine kinase [Myxococcus dinghuensis]